MNTIKHFACLGLTTVLLTAGGCMSNPNSSPDFGASVSSLQRNQAQNPDAGVLPEEAKPMDGGVSARVVDRHREASAPKGDTVQNEIHINVGN